MITTVRRNVYTILEDTSLDNRRGRILANAFTLLILLNVFAAVVETDANIYQQYGGLLDLFAFLSVAVFVVEYILRVWCCTENPRYHTPVTGRLHYMATPIALIDLIVILPFLLLPFLDPSQTAFWLIRFSRIFWILKLSHYSHSLKKLGKVLKAKKGEIFVAFFAMIVLLVIASALMYFAERDAQPQKFSSVIASLWWGVETLTTIGYGDMVPVTPLGKFIGSIVALIGVGLFALPAGILAAGFVETVRKKEEEDNIPPHICPHCGKDIREVPGKKEQ